MSAAPSFPDPIPGIIPFGTVTIFAGAPGVGKTAMLADWIQRWRTGQPICDKPTNAPVGGFYYIAADRQWASHAQWFAAVGYPDIPYYSLADDRDFKLEDLRLPHNAYYHFTRCFEKLNPPPGAHVFVDPVSPLFIPGDPNKARDVAVALLRFSRLCAERFINITAAAHFGKQKADVKDAYARPQDRIAGSGAFSGFSDTQIYLVDPQVDGHAAHTLGWVPRHGPPEEFLFTRNPETGLFEPFELYTEMDRQQKALDLIPYEPTSTSVLIELLRTKLGVSRAQAERYLKQLAADNRIVKVRRGVFRRAKPS